MPRLAARRTTDWYAIPDLERQVRLAHAALARARRTYGERSARYAEKLGELRWVEQRLAELRARG